MEPLDGPAMDAQIQAVWDEARRRGAIVRASIYKTTVEEVLATSQEMERAFAEVFGEAMYWPDLDSLRRARARLVPPSASSVNAYLADLGLSEGGAAPTAVDVLAGGDVEAIADRQRFCQLCQGEHLFRLAFSGVKATHGHFLIDFEVLYRHRAGLVAEHAVDGMGHALPIPMWPQIIDAIDKHAHGAAVKAA